MSESAVIPPSSPSKPNQVDGKLNLQRGLIHQGFRDLAIKYQTRGTWRPAQPIICIDSDQDLWNAALSRLQSVTLPSLRQLIDPLQTLLNPSQFRTADGPTLEHIIEIQTGLDEKMDHLVSVAASIRRQSLFPVLPPDYDRGKELKAFSCQQLLSKLESPIQDLRSMFYHCFRTTNEFRLPPATDAPPTRMPIIRRRPSLSPESASESIALALKWLACSELGKIRYNWENELSNFGSIRDLFLTLIIPTPQEPKNNQFGVHFLREDVSRLAELAITVVRLTRLFHRKMVSCVFNLKTSPQAFSEIGPQQLQTLTNSPQVITETLGEIYENLLLAEGNALERISESILRSFSNMKHHFHSIIIFITFYVLPPLNHSLSDHPAPHNHILTWIATWYQLFCNVTHRYSQAIYSLTTPRPDEPLG
ncbi:hypothetical protein VP01_1386g10 [Puccinia sorghi]|uniref:Uncharacterized protein n=1 Tax=Puccinia sorghi TaxID=27349 RepID=A0A0L6VLV2_9BASI|nr:hypothetical protein VP01_1386g10 [Puccinia sorghi]